MAFFDKWFDTLDRGVSLADLLDIFTRQAWCVMSFSHLCQLVACERIPQSTDKYIFIFLFTTVSSRVNLSEKQTEVKLKPLSFCVCFPSFHTHPERKRLLAVKGTFFVVKTAKLSWLSERVVQTVRRMEPAEFVCFYSTHGKTVFIVHKNISPYLVFFRGVLRWCFIVQSDRHTWMNTSVWPSCRLTLHFITWFKLHLSVF